MAKDWIKPIIKNRGTDLVINDDVIYKTIKNNKASNIELPALNLLFKDLSYPIKANN